MYPILSYPILYISYSPILSKFIHPTISLAFPGGGGGDDRSLPNRGRSISILDDNDANVRVAFVGDASSWQHMVWFNYSVIEGYIAQECTDMGLSCQIAMVPRGKFCSLKVSLGGWVGGCSAFLWAGV